MTKAPRGSALLTAVVVILVMTVIGVGIINFSSRELAGATSTAHEQALVACAEAARLKLVARFHALGFTPGALSALYEQLGTATGDGTTFAVGGHYDSSPTSASAVVVSTQVSYLPDTSVGPTSSMQDLSNTGSLLGQGGRPVKVVVHCLDGAGGRQLEVEFGIRFGL